MAAKRKHKDVEFHVGSTDRYTPTKVFDTLAEASEYAVAIGTSHAEPMVIDVVVHSRAGARWLGGDYAVEVYNEDPEASIHERIIVKVESQGRIA